MLLEYNTICLGELLDDSNEEKMGSIVTGRMVFCRGETTIYWNDLTVWSKRGSDCRADDFQNLTNKLCYTFGRCTRAVSMATPAYYAHLAAYRARVWYLAKRDKRRLACDPEAYFPVLPECVNVRLKNRMYFL